MMGLTRKQTIRLHKEIWDWLSKNPKKQKDDWPRWEFNGGIIKYTANLCFLCEQSHGCTSCLLDPQPMGEECLGGLFDNWQGAKTPAARKKYAALIRDLPVRTDI